ncbi:MAG TPA: J domain-containing protein [Polyangiaceae bacterium]|jgi:curved DNA-binding protein CbpA|nr:J domain-containing protein [Polyangiaceae bacterium]
MATAEDRERLQAWVEVVDDSSYYELLGVLDLADGAAIQAAFHEFALAFHPDGHEDGTEAERTAARYVFRRGAEAYRVLSDPDLRGRYDLALASGHLRLIGGEPSHRVETKTNLRSLEDLCETPAAKLLARRADEQINLGKLEEARWMLQDAMKMEDHKSEELADRIDALALALFARGE